MTFHTIGLKEIVQDCRCRQTIGIIVTTNQNWKWAGHCFFHQNFCLFHAVHIKGVVKFFPIEKLPKVFGIVTLLRKHFGKGQRQILFTEKGHVLHIEVVSFDVVFNHLLQELKLPNFGIP